MVELINCYVIPSYTNNGQYIFEIAFGRKLKSSVTSTILEDYYRSYENALEVALEAALNLIKDES